MANQLLNLPILSPHMFRCAEIKGFESLAKLALDLRWSWNHQTDVIWEQLDEELWTLTHNPWVILQTVAKEKLEMKLADPVFRKRVDDMLSKQKQDLDAPGWFEESHPQSALKCVAYFSMEYMLSEALPIYSGGLGNVAGDQLKSASDLGIPVAAVGLLYQQGYFRQMIDKNGAQQVLYPYNDPGQLPIIPLRKPNGDWLRLEIKLPGWSMWLRTWQVQVGRVKLYLLDSNDAANFPVHRGITSELYGGGVELRFLQEMVLGIGGWRLLEELGIKPQVCHLNEGHAAFAILERASSFMKETGKSFEIALAATRPGNLFTTHTAVPAGFDRFPPFLIEQYLGHYAQKNLGISLHDLLALGRKNPQDDQEFFNMAYLAIRGSGAVNGVSRLHGQVSRQIFEELFPRWPESEVPVEYVTNGVHMPSWDSASADALWSETCGAERWLGPIEGLEKLIRSAPDEKLWKMRNASRQNLIVFARTRVARQLAARGASAELVERAGHLFDPHTLTLGFARRFATYKRPNLLLHDPERLKRILNHAQRPVQLLIAGKAHPADKPGQALIKEWMRFIMQQGGRAHVIFLSDYDMLLTEKLVQGVDIWLNTPRRPWEACGTSGMKVLVNGGLNLSELDGWWAEAYKPELGWALGDGLEHGEDPVWDGIEAGNLYDLLESQVIPEFYARDAEGMPRAWLARIRESMAHLTPRYSANRSVREYTKRYYLPAAKLYSARAADGGAKASQITQWKHLINQEWSKVRFGELKLATVEDRHLFEIQVYLNDIDPETVKVQLFANATKEAGSELVEMLRVRCLTCEASTYLYRASVPASRPPADYTPRIIPHLEGVPVPLEMAQIIWEH